jgi:hypothetical protein
MTHTQLIAQLEDSLNQLEALKASTQHTLAMARELQASNPLANYLAAFGDEHENLGVGAI